jgi:hypothetical protein
MFRNTMLTLAAAAAVGAAMLMPTEAAARPYGGRHAHPVRHAVHVNRVVHHRAYVRHGAYVRHRAYVRHHARPVGVYVRHRHYAPYRHYVRHRPVIRIAVYPARHVRYSRCIVRRWVATPAGPRLRLVNRCYRPHVYGVYRR